MSDSRIFQQMAEGAGLFDRSDGCRLAITGPDRAKFLHNLLTNEVKRLAPGKGCEAFVTSIQGRTLAFVTVLAGEDVILLRTDAGGIDALMPHLRKYGVFDDVTIVDQSAATFEYHLAGPAAGEIVRASCGRLPDEFDLAHVTTELDGKPVRVVRESPTALPGFTLIGDATAADSIKQGLRIAGGDLGLVEAGPLVFEVCRIEAGTPVFGKDVTEKNLPQEIGRDARAINFVKGCYLGQETVARLDALGHVNQVLRGLVFEPGEQCPEPGAAVEEAGKRVGTITSSAFSPVRGAPIALAIVRTSHIAHGTSVQVPLRDGGSKLAAMVSDFPLAPPDAGPN
jgi:folate-binding protein YgfZ